MQTIIRIFNIVIMAISVVAGVFLFMPPALTFNSKITINVEKFSQFVPETEFSKDINIAELLGTESIYVGIRFQLDSKGIGEMKDGNREKINESIVASNVDEIVALLHEPVDLMTDFIIRANIKRLIQEQVTSYVNQAVESYKEKNPSAIHSTTEEIMEEVGINDAYFTSFSYALYDAANADGATLDSTNAVLFDQIDQALARAEESGAVDVSTFGDSQKEAIRSSLSSVMTSLNLVNDDGTLKKISQISYIYLSDYLKKQLTGTVSAEELEQKVGEETPDYADRLLGIFVSEKMPDIFYEIVGYVSLGLYIGLFVFAGVWGLLLLITLLKTFTKKPWTIFGFWFWIVGLVQLVVGFGLTAIGKYAIDKIDIASFGLPISKVQIYLRTYALVPSFLFIACVVIAIVYGFFKRILKSSIESHDLKERYKEQKEAEQEEQEEEAQQA